MLQWCQPLLEEFMKRKMKGITS